MDDYRCTTYDESFEGIPGRKSDLVKEIHSEHPRAVDMYNYVSSNELPTNKPQFMKVYNDKCGYCGVNNQIIPVKLFEIDHFVNKEHPKFSSPKEAGTMDNLVLSCRDCNRWKSDFPIEDEDFAILYPDDGKIAESYIRTDDYYIRVSPSKVGDSKVEAFYEKLKLGAEMRRLDYLLMNMYGLANKEDLDPTIKDTLNSMIQTMQKKRNGFMFNSEEEV